MAESYNSQLVRNLFAIDQFHNAHYGAQDAFELYHKIQEQDQGGHASSGIGLPALGHALAGSAGTALSHIVLYPLDLVITRLQVQKQLRRPGEAPSAAAQAEDAEYRSLQDAATKIYNNEGGLSAFWNGWKEDTAKSIVDSFLFFLAYNALRKRQQNKIGSENLSVLNELSVGIAAGALSKLVTTPIQQIVTRKQTAAMVSARDPTASLPMNMTNKLTVKDIALQIRSERGLKGFWAGYSASLILTLNPAITFLLQNLLKRAIAKSRREDPGPKTLFLVAAVSKAIASTITYPFSLAKSRAQVATSPSSPAFAEKLNYADTSSPPEYLEKPDLNTSKPVYKATKYAKMVGRFLFAQQISQLAVIRSLREIYRTEGLMGLYSGLDADVVKGFLGHGLSMALKERIHVLIISTYYLVLKTTKRWPEDLGSIRDQASQEFQRVRTTAGDMAQDASERIQNVTETVTDGVKNAVANNSMAQNASERVQNVTGTVSDGVKNAVANNNMAQDTSERVQNVTETVSEGVKNAISNNDE